MFAILAAQAEKERYPASEDVPRLLDEAREHVAQLRKWADEMEKKHGPDVWPGNPKNIRGFSEQAEERMK